MSSMTVYGGNWNDGERRIIATSSAVEASQLTGISLSLISITTDSAELPVALSEPGVPFGSNTAATALKAPVSHFVKISDINVAVHLQPAYTEALKQEIERLRNLVDTQRAELQAVSDQEPIGKFQGKFDFRNGVPYCEIKIAGSLPTVGQRLYATPTIETPLEAEVYAVRYITNWDGEGDIEYALLTKGPKGELVSYDNGQSIDDMLCYEGDEILNLWPLGRATAGKLELLKLLKELTTDTAAKNELYPELIGR